MCLKVSVLVVMTQYETEFTDQGQLISLAWKFLLRGQGHFHFAKGTSIGNPQSLWEAFERASRQRTRAPYNGLQGATAHLAATAWNTGANPFSF